MPSNDLYWDQLPQLFSRILHLWKESPTHNNWAMEKLMEIFCKHIASDPGLVQFVDFPAFLEGFFESGQLIQYPDFVINNVALMAGEVILSESPELKGLQETAFALIRYPLEYWLVDKGHITHVTFQLYSKFIRHRVMLLELERYSFDISQAVAYAIVSPHNYTRKSASMYLTDLIGFAYGGTGQHTERKVKLRVDITNCLQQVHRRLSQQHGISDFQAGDDSPLSEPSKHMIDRDAQTRYCQLVCNSAKSCPEWFKVMTGQGIFIAVLELCCLIAEKESGDEDGLYVTCAHLVVQLCSSSDWQGSWKQHHQQLVHLMKVLCQHGSAFTVTEILSMAHTVLMGLRDVKSDEKNLLLELSLLPLFVLVSAVPDSVYKFSPEIVSKVQAIMASSNVSKPLPLMKEAVKNLYSSLENEISCSQEHSEFLMYLSLQEAAPPPNVTKPLLCGTQLRDDEVVNFLLFSFFHLEEFKNKSCHNVKNILAALGCFMKYPRLPHKNIQAAMACCIKLITTQAIPNQEFLLSLLETLQLKLVDLNPNVQEAAVKAVGDLMLWDGLNLTLPQVSQCARALWQCVDYKTEGVAMQVLEVLINASSVKRLDSFITLISASKAEVTQKAEEFLISGNWDNIKPVAFTLLSKLCTNHIMLKYAQGSFKRYNTGLRIAVLNYMKATFEESYTTQSSVDEQVSKVMSLLAIGWGDLLLDKAISVETCNLRQVTSIMEALLSFMDRKDINKHVDLLISELVPQDLSFNDGSEGSLAFDDICDSLLYVHDHLNKEQMENALSSPRDLNNEYLDCGSSEEGPPAKKVKRDISDSHGVEKNGERSSLKLQLLLNSVLDGTKKVSSELLKQRYQDTTVTVMGDDVLDSTKELTPLMLTNEPVPSRQLILKSLSLENQEERQKVCDIMSWAVFKESLRRIQPVTLSSEAERSTDEYERNCMMLIYDFHQLLNKSFKDMRQDLEKQLISLILNKFSGILSHNQQEKTALEEALVVKNLISFLHKVNTILSNRDKFCEFVFDHKKSVMIKPIQMENTKFTLDSFLDRLNALRCLDAERILAKEKYPAQEGLDALLDTFCEGNKETACGLNGNVEMTTKNRNECFSSLDDTPQNTSSVDSVTQNISNVCKQFKPSGSSVLDKLSSKDHQILCSIVNEVFQVETIEDALKQIISKDRKDNSYDILRFMKMLSQQFVLGVFDEKLHKAELFSLFAQLQAWFLSEREFDSDEENDPSALDCF